MTYTIDADTIEQLNNHAGSDITDTIVVDRVSANTITATTAVIGNMYTKNEIDNKLINVEGGTIDPDIFNNYALATHTHDSFTNASLNGTTTITDDLQVNADTTIKGALTVQSAKFTQNVNVGNLCTVAGMFSSVWAAIKNGLEAATVSADTIYTKSLDVTENVNLPSIVLGKGKSFTLTANDGTTLKLQFSMDDGLYGTNNNTKYTIWHPSRTDNLTEQLNNFINQTNNLTNRLVQEMKLMSGMEVNLGNLHFHLHMYPNYDPKMSTDTRCNSIYIYMDFIPMTMTGELRFTGPFMQHKASFESITANATLVVKTPLSGGIKDVDRHELPYGMYGWLIADYLNEPDPAKTGHQYAYVHLGAFSHVVNGVPGGWLSVNAWEGLGTGMEGDFSVTWVKTLS